MLLRPKLWVWYRMLGVGFGVCDNVVLLLVRCGEKSVSVEAGPTSHKQKSRSYLVRGVLPSTERLRAPKKGRRRAFRSAIA